MTTRIDSIELRNYGCFRNINVTFHEHLTVLVAANGQGKSVLARAAVAALEPYVAAMLNSNWEGITLREVRRARAPDGTTEHALPTTLSANLVVDEIRLKWSNEFKSIDSTHPGAVDVQMIDVEGVTRRLTAELQSFADGRSKTPPVLPVISYYGTRRAFRYGQLESENQPANPTTSRLRGYTYPLTSVPHFLSFDQWYRRMYLERLDEQRRKLPSPHAPTDRLAAVEGAVQTVLKPTGWESLTWDFVEQTVAAEHPVYGRMPTSMLSDGIQIMLAVVADLACRCVRLNPQLGADAAKKTPGIVIIDEVDLHLHPGWQQLVVGALREAFPLVQFILTTHSPQVLSTVPAECIRILEAGPDGDIQVRTPKQQTEGVPSEDVMATVMRVASSPDIPIRRDLEHYQRLIQEGAHDTDVGRALRKRLEDHFGPRHPEVLDLDRLIRFRRVIASKPEGAS